MDIKAYAKHIRISPRRVRLVADVIRGLPVARAEEQLMAISRRATLPLQKLLHTAIANAEQNFDCVRENLYIKTIAVNEGSMLKRSRPRAFGRATSIRKRSAHILLILAEREEGKRGGKARREALRSQRREVAHKKKEHATHEHEGKQRSPTADHRAEATVPGRLATRHHVEGAKENVHDRGKSKGFLKRLFNRKSGSG